MFCYCWVTKLCLTLCDPIDSNLQAPLSMGFPRQEYWTVLPFPSPRDLSDPVMKPVSLALASGFFTIEPSVKPFVKVLSCSVISDFLQPPWIAACHAPLPWGILQAKILEWTAMPSSRGSSQPRQQTQTSLVVGRFYTSEPPGKPESQTKPAFQKQRLMESYNGRSMRMYFWQMVEGCVWTNMKVRDSWRKGSQSVSLQEPHQCLIMLKVWEGSPTALAGEEKTDHSEIYSESSPSWKAVRKKDCGLKGILPLQSLLLSECLLGGGGQRLGEGGSLHPKDYISKQWLSGPWERYF